MVSSVQMTSLTQVLMCVLSTWFYDDVNGQLKSRPLHIWMTVLNISCRAPKHNLSDVYRKSSWKNLNGGPGWKDKSSAVIWLSFCWIKDWQWRVWWRACRRGPVLLNCVVEWKEGKVESKMKVWERCSVCAFMCCVSIPPYLYRLVAVFCLYEHCAGVSECVSAWELKEDLSASVEGGCFEQRRRGAVCEAALQRDG